MKGIVEAYSPKTKGIKLNDGNWYNPEDSIKSMIEDNIKGKTVELTMTDATLRKFGSFKIDPSIPTSQSSHKTSVKESRFSKGASLNTAIALIAISNAAKDKEPNVLLDLATDIAKKIEAWVKSE